MKTRQNTLFKYKKDDKSRNKNFHNSQNYTLGNNEKKKLLSLYFINYTNYRIKRFFTKINDFFTNISPNFFIFLIIIFFWVLIMVPISLITIYTHNWIFLLNEAFDILVITFILTPIFIFILMKLYSYIFNYNILFKLFYPLFFLINIFNYFFIFISVFILRITPKNKIIKKTPYSKLFEKYKIISKDYAENDFYKITLK